MVAFNFGRIQEIQRGDAVVNLIVITLGCNEFRNLIIGSMM